jgi:hypothetical protein
MEEETAAMIRGDRFAQQLQRPCRRGVRRHIDVEDTPRGVLHEHKHVEQAKVAVTITQKSQATIAWA